MIFIRHSKLNLALYSQLLNPPQLFSYLKRQVTEDSIHYERALPYEPPADRRRAVVEKAMNRRVIKPNE